MEYPPLPNVFAVLKAAALRADFRRLVGSVHFLPVLFTSTGSGPDPLGEDDLLAVVRDEDRLLKNRLLSQTGKDSLNHFEYTDYRAGPGFEDQLVLRLKLNHPQRYIARIEQAPASVQAVFSQGRCAWCTEVCSRRISFTLHGVPRFCCGSSAFRFTDPSPEAIGWYQDLFLWEEEARRSKVR